VRLALLALLLGALVIVSCAARQAVSIEPGRPECNYDRWYLPGLPKLSACDRLPA
jgi:hypothetical protein